MRRWFIAGLFPNVALRLIQLDRTAFGSLPPPHKFSSAIPGGFATSHALMLNISKTHRQDHVKKPLLWWAAALYSFSLRQVELEKHSKNNNHDFMANVPLVGPHGEPGPSAV